MLLKYKKTSDNRVLTLVNTFETRNEADSKYHFVLAAAAVSDLPRHGAVILSDAGYQIAGYMYAHGETEDDNIMEEQ